MFRALFSWMWGGLVWPFFNLAIAIPVPVIGGIVVWGLYRAIAG